MPWQKLKESRNTRFCRSGRQNITQNFFCWNLTQIPNVETEEKTKYQNNCREEIPNCRSWYQIAKTEEKMKYQNNCRDRHKYQIAEAERQSKYQILQKRKTKYHSKIFLQKLNSNTKCRNWREDKIPKQLQRQDKNTKLQKLIPNYKNWREDEIPKQLQR
jgi:hypothetical protein